MTAKKPGGSGQAKQRTPKPAVARPHGSRRDQVIATALAMFNEQGVGPVSTNHIASAVGISPGNLYYHFRNKEDIVWALLEAMREDIRGHFAHPLEPEPSALWTRLFEGGVDIMWRYRFFAEDRGAVRRLGPKFAAVGRQFQEDFVNLATTFCKSAIANGWFNDEIGNADLKRIVGNLYIIATGGIEFSRNQSQHDHATRADVEESQRQAFHFLLPYYKPDALAIVKANFGI